MKHLLQNRRGQTSVEYLLLLAAAFITGYVVITGPLASFTERILADVRGGIQSTVKDGEWRKGDPTNVGDRNHPGSESRGRALHL